MKKLRIILAILLLGCLLPMPYGYYEIMRIIAIIGFGILANEAYQLKQNTNLYILIALILLFQPFSKIYLGRTLWNIVDVATAIYLIFPLFSKNHTKS